MVNIIKPSTMDPEKMGHFPPKNDFFSKDLHNNLSKAMTKTESYMKVKRNISLFSLVIGNVTPSANKV